MRILVTVGTTPFDALIHRADKELAAHDLKFQIADGHYKPKNGTWFRFGEISSLYDWSELVITHAGAGSVYTLLEKRKRILVVPNLERRDPHQKELARYIEVCRFAYVLWDPKKIGSSFDEAIRFQAEPYESYPFFKGEEISAVLLSSFPSQL